MAKVIVGMTTSLDGFVADPNGSATRLYPDLEALRGTDYMNALIEATGAVVMGRKTFEMAGADSYVGNYEFQVPIFVLTHHPPDVAPKQDEHLTFTFVSGGVQSAIDQARAAAGDKAVQVVGGVEVIRQLLRAVWSTSFTSTSCRCCWAPASGSWRAPTSSTSGSQSSACGRVGREPASPSASRVSCDPPLRRPSYVNALSPNVLAEYS